MAKKSLKSYQKSGGNYASGPRMQLKKPSDLGEWYFPGINEVLEKIEKNIDQQWKYCTLPKTIGVISTVRPHKFPLISAKAALLSHVTGMNAIPLLLKYGSPQNLPQLINQISPNFSSLYFTNLSRLESDILKEQRSLIELPHIMEDESLSVSVVAAVENIMTLLKLKKPKVRISLEGQDQLALHILKLLMEEKYEHITLLDDQGALYPKRALMNKEKNDLADIKKGKKDSRTREEILSETDIYITTLSGEVGSEVTSKLPAKSGIIALRSEKINEQKSQIVISTIAKGANHMTDLHAVSVFSSAISGGKKPSSLGKLSKALASSVGSPKAKAAFTHLLDKDLVKKALKHL